MAKLSDYSVETDEIYREKLKEVKKKLPSFLNKYFTAKSDLLPSTLFGYAVDLTVFFEWAKGYVSDFSDVPVRKIPFEILKSFDSDDINTYVKDYLTKYEHEGKIYRNDLNGKSRKLASLKSMYKYFLSKEKIDKDPTALVSLKMKSDYEIVYLQPNEVAELLDCINDGEALKNTDSEKN